MEEQINYKLGELSADIKTLKEDMAEIKMNVKSLNVWKWKTIGAMGTLAGLISFITTLFLR